MHAALLVSDILTPILSFLSPHDLAVACRICWMFWQHAAPLLWADLSGPGLQALYMAFPADAITPLDLDLWGQPRASCRELTRPLTYEESSRIRTLAGFIRKMRIYARFDLPPETDSPLGAVQDMVGGKIFSNLQTIELADLALTPFRESAGNDLDSSLEYILEVFRRSLPLVIGPSTKHVSFYDGPPGVPGMDFMNLLLRIMIQEGAAPWTFRVPTWSWWSIQEPSTDPKTLTESMGIALTSVKHLSLMYGDPMSAHVIALMIDAASRLPRLAELDVQCHDPTLGTTVTSSEFLPCSETAFPQLQTIRIRGSTEDIQNTLQRVPQTRLQNIELECKDEDGAEFYPYLAGHSQVKSFTLRIRSLDLRDVLTRLNMRQLAHLTLASQFDGPPSTDADVELLADSFPNLVGLEIREPKEQEEWGVTISSLQMLSRRCPQLQTLALSVNIQKAVLIAEPAAYNDPTVSKTQTHSSIRDLDLWCSRGLGEGGASIEEFVAFVVRTYPNLQQGRCGHYSSIPVWDALANNRGVNRDTDHEHHIDVRVWWEVWKGVKRELGDSFVVAYTRTKCTYRGVHSEMRSF